MQTRYFHLTDFKRRENGFQVNPHLKSGLFFFHVLIVDSNFFLNENFDLSQALQSIFRREIFEDRVERRNFFVEYHPLHTAEYAAGL